MQIRESQTQHLHNTNKFTRNNPHIVLDRQKTHYVFLLDELIAIVITKMT